MEEEYKLTLSIAVVFAASLLGFFGIATWSLNMEAHNAQMQLIEIQKLKQCKTN
ncbi:hypothetical protein [Acinetobacter nosocomialis]